MLLINPDGLFRGDRLAMCSRKAWLYWTPIFLCANGYGRFEVNHARIASQIGKHAPTEAELEACVQEYFNVHLLFFYTVGVKRWGQWDADKRFLPRWKTSQDKQSPNPPEPDYTQWLKAYHGDQKTGTDVNSHDATENKGLPKVSEDFGGFLANSERSSSCVVGVGVEVGVKNICASPDGDSRIGWPSDSFNHEKAKPICEALTTQQEQWFEQWWSIYWLRKSRKPARDAFRKHVGTAQRFAEVMAATRAQSPEMMAREPSKRPHGATWLNQERWTDELVAATARDARTSSISDAMASLYAGRDR